MGFNGSPFLLDLESVPRVVSISFRSSIVGLATEEHGRLVSSVNW